MLINVGGIFIERELDTTDEPVSPAEAWRVFAIKQLWLDQPDFDFREAIRHPSFARHVDELEAWHRDVQRFIASYVKRAAHVNKRLAKLAPPGNIFCPTDPWEHARRSAFFADSIGGLRKDMIEGGFWCWMKRGPLDDD